VVSQCIFHHPEESAIIGTVEQVENIALRKFPQLNSHFELRISIADIVDDLAHQNLSSVKSAIKLDDKHGASLIEGMSRAIQDGPLAITSSSPLCAWPMALGPGETCR
jgi:hypothetical protein